jgi:CDP-diacylglycerol---serine O-phosphatidyltransferase
MQIAADGSRDRRIEDLSNLYLIHPLARALLSPAIRVGLSANAVSLAGLASGAVAAGFFTQWNDAWLALLGLIFAIGWMVADGLDGMIARATGTASATGRFLDGVCDHGVFVLIYVALATSLGTVEGWMLAITAGGLHAAQSSLYEGERARFHRRALGIAQPTVPIASGNPLVRLYDRLATSIDHLALPLERRMAADADPLAFGQAYAADAVDVMRSMTLLSANARVAGIFVACLAGDPALFWIFEIAVLTPVAALALVAHRQVERRHAALSTARPSAALILDGANKEQGTP